MNKCENLRIWVFLEQTSTMAITDLPLSLIDIIKLKIKTDPNAIELLFPTGRWALFCKCKNIQGFYFAVEQNESMNSNDYIVELKPSSYFNSRVRSSTVEQKQLGPQFENWFDNVVRYYATIGEIQEYVDPILRQYEEEFYTEFAFEQDGEEDKVYDLNTQLLIDQFLEKIQLKLEEAKTPANETTVKDIQEDVAKLREEYTSLTKGEFREKMSKVFAKIRKGGISLLKQVWDETKKYAIKKLIEGALDPTQITKLTDSFF